MRLSKKQKAALHWLAKRDCSESHTCERVVTDPRKNHRAQVRRHGFGQTLYSLKRKELIVRTYYGDGRVGPYDFTDQGRVVEQTLWKKRV